MLLWKHELKPPGTRNAKPTPAEAKRGMERYRRMTEALHGFDRPVIAAIDGVAFGAGLTWASALIRWS